QTCALPIFRCIRWIVFTESRFDYLIRYKPADQCQYKYTSSDKEPVHGYIHRFSICRVDCCRCCCTQFSKHDICTTDQKVCRETGRYTGERGSQTRNRVSSECQEYDCTKRRQYNITCIGCK